HGSKAMPGTTAIPAAATTRPGRAPARRLTVTLLVPTLNEIVGMKAIMPQVQRRWVDQILVLDGGSTDGTIDWARPNGYDVHVQQRAGIRQGYMEVLGRIEGEAI